MLRGDPDSHTKEGSENSLDVGRVENKCMKS